MTDRVEVAIVGGGIVGCSLLYWLTRLGWSDCLLLEKNELTSGSTWHAAGNVTYFGHYSSITGLYVNSIRTYLEAERESGRSVGFHPAGSLRLATSASELEAYRRLEPMYRRLGVDYEIVGRERIAELHPLLLTEQIVGAAHTPTDGHVDASGATHAMAAAARKRGAEIRRHDPVVEVSRAKGGWRLQTEKNRVEARHVVFASSFWTRELALQLGLELPLYALEHHEIVTDTLAALDALDFEVPTVRDPYAQANTRQEGSGFLCGVYESRPRFWAVDGIPPDFHQELLEPDIGRLEDNLLRVIERIPAFGEAGIKAVNNGPICYTPDGCPLLGPVESLPGIWLASGFAIGIGTGGGSGEYLAHWMTAGKPPYELPIVYPSRFNDSWTRDRSLESIRKTYVSGYITPE